MGNYTDVDLVQAEFKSVTFGSSTAVTSNDVDEYITQEENTLDSKIGLIYVVPISSSATISLSIMKRLSTFLVKARILDILPVKTGKQDPDQGGTSQALRDLVEADLKAILDKTMILPDATLVNSSGGVRSYTRDNDIAQTFQKGVDQW